MDVAKYSANTRIGYWLEELSLQEEKMKIFIKKRDRGDLLVQKARKLFSNLLREISLAEPHPFVRFGDVVQLLAPDMPGSRCVKHKKLGVVLSGLVGEREVDCIQHFVEGCVLTASPLLNPCVRNSFVIRSADCFERDGEPLKFGQAFNLCPVENLTGTGLYVESEIPNISTELGPSKHPGLHFTSYRNTYCRWQALSWHPSHRMETEGAPVPPNFRVVINHVSSNRNLAVETQFWFPTYFGMECEVSVHTFRDVHRCETSENMWMFVCQRSLDLKERLKLNDDDKCCEETTDIKKPDDVCREVDDKNQLIRIDDDAMYCQKMAENMDQVAKVDNSVNVKCCEQLANNSMR